jgi:hypothetical protein
VALLARRRERIEAAAKEAGPDAVAVECDVTDEASVGSAISSAAEALGGIDNLVYTPAIGPLKRLVETDAETWRRVFDTNVMGAALTTAAAIPHPDIGFTNLIVGECAGGEGDSQTGFNAGWDRELTMENYPLWLSRGCMPGELMPVKDLISVVHTILQTDACTSMPVVVARGAPTRAVAVPVADHA